MGGVQLRRVPPQNHHWRLHWMELRVPTVEVGSQPATSGRWLPAERGASSWISARGGERARHGSRLAIDHEEVGAGWSVRLCAPLFPVLQGPEVEPVARGEGRL